jgi:deoxyribodipyrimidine photo-lyase
MNDSLFPPTRQAALARLRDFAPRAGSRYAQGRNTDAGPGAPSATSLLSPYLRRRLITEEEVVSAVLSAHSIEAAEKFVQEVCWRTYWKGWLELRPSVWARFLAARDRDSVADARALEEAEEGRTGIEGFDDWAHELRETGYLHNHARMWFASIWIFTLRLPWALGADFFLRHLIDADPASNTLSWRWVAGLQTAGKTYLATEDNIARYTQGRFAPKGLAREAIALTEVPLERAQPLPSLPRVDPATPALLLVTDDDLCPDFLLTDQAAIRAATLVVDPALSWGDAARTFAASAADDVAARLRGVLGDRVTVGRQLDAPTLIDAARAVGVDRIVTAYAPVGPVADRLAEVTAAAAMEGIVIERVRRDWDDRFWPHATKGFFPFKEQIPHILRERGLA